MDTVEYRGHHIEIHTDDNPENPRTSWDNLGRMVCFHRRYNLGDKHDFSQPSDVEEHIKETHSLCLSLFLYDHSGITMSTGNAGYPFNDRWDAGQVGYIYVTLEEVKKEYSCKVVTPTIRKKAYSVLEAEVKEYDDFITGNVYGYNVEETGDSCWGFFGDTKYTIEEAKGDVDGHIKEERKKHVKQLKGWIKNRVGLLYREAGQLSGGITA